MRLSMIPELFRPRSALSAEAKLSNNSFIIHFARKVSHVKKLKQTINLKSNVYFLLTNMPQTCLF